MIGVLRYIGRGVGWALLQPYRSAAKNVAGSATRLREMAEAQSRVRQQWRRSYAECEAMRPNGAMPLDRIYRRFLWMKRVWIVAFVMVVCTIVVQVVAGNSHMRILGAAMTPMAVALFIQAVRCELRREQMRCEELMPLRKFLARPGWFWRVMNPEL